MPIILNLNISIMIKRMAVVAILFICFCSKVIFAKSETINGFEMQSCSPTQCVFLTADQVEKSFLGSLYAFGNSKFKFKNLRTQKTETVFATDGYYDPVSEVHCSKTF